MKQYAFFFDSGACSGCKTCQIACRDKHDLSEGVQYRRIYEIAGGQWEKEENGNWKNSIIAYNLSMSCNHCENAPCVEACPTNAMHKRKDGIVLVDQEKCMGCKYCSWACAYEAPQYDEEKGQMTKCDFCCDYIDEGKDPSCVAACPMRVLHFGEADSLREKYGNERVYPLPSFEESKPSLIVKKHKHYTDKDGTEFNVINREEISHG